MLDATGTYLVAVPYTCEFAEALPKPPFYSAKILVVLLYNRP